MSYNKIDNEYELGFISCYKTIKGWKTSHFRKNSKHPANITLCCAYGDPEPRLWKYLLELSVNGKIISRYRIHPVVYYTIGAELPRKQYISFEFITVEKFIPFTHKEQ